MSRKSPPDLYGPAPDIALFTTDRIATLASLRRVQQENPDKQVVMLVSGKCAPVLFESSDVRALIQRADAAEALLAAQAVEAARNGIADISTWLPAASAAAPTATATPEASVADHTDEELFALALGGQGGSNLGSIDDEIVALLLDDKSDTPAAAKPVESESEAILRRRQAALDAGKKDLAEYKRTQAERFKPKLTALTPSRVVNEGGNRYTVFVARPSAAVPKGSNKDVPTAGRRDGITNPSKRRRR
ncbi:MAG: hypothetical protein P1U34_07185 [Coxiellaceae bacterium]|nr:hypothetical protein [Coxiellaceae bacterium]